ncbi:unnamed protein product, partial [Mesorhabditis belari]|uniref:Tensin n=1 Tax=Mesorhabditis belari TaxID=2138241 RepID=A0AAF3FDQ7_9BILA
MPPLLCFKGNRQGKRSKRGSTLQRNGSKASSEMGSSDEGLTLHNVTKRIIAITSPSTSTEKVYRESLSKIAHQLKSEHFDQFKIWNVSRTRRDLQRFGAPVVEMGWPAPLAPPLDRLCVMCKQWEQWLSSDPSHIIVVHSKGEPSRAALAVCAFMHYNAICANDDSVEERFSMQRYADRFVGAQWQPSNKRYLTYFANLLSGKTRVNPAAIYLQKIVLHHFPKSELSFKIYEKMKPVHVTTTITTKDLTKFEIDQEVKLRGDILLKGIKIEKNSQVTVFFCQFNTCALELIGKTPNLEFFKEELDLIFSNNDIDNRCKLELIFSLDPPKVQRKRSIIISEVSRANSYENFEEPEDNSESVEYSRIQKSSRAGPASEDSGVSTESPSKEEGMGPPPVPPKPHRPGSAQGMIEEEQQGEYVERRGVLPAAVKPLVKAQKEQERTQENGILAQFDEIEGEIGTENGGTKEKTTPCLEPDLVGKDRYDKASKCFSYVPAKSLKEAYSQPKKPPPRRIIESSKENLIDDVRPEDLSRAREFTRSVDLVRRPESPKWTDSIDAARSDPRHLYSMDMRIPTSSDSGRLPERPKWEEEIEDARKNDSLVSINSVFHLPETNEMIRRLLGGGQRQHQAQIIHIEPSEAQIEDAKDIMARSLSQEPQEEDKGQALPSSLASIQAQSYLPPVIVERSQSPIPNSAIAPWEFDHRARSKSRERSKSKTPGPEPRTEPRSESKYEPAPSDTGFWGTEPKPVEDRGRSKFRGFLRLKRSDTMPARSDPKPDPKSSTPRSKTPIFERFFKSDSERRHTWWGRPKTMKEVDKDEDEMTTSCSRASIQDEATVFQENPLFVSSAARGGPRIAPPRPEPPKGWTRTIGSEPEPRFGPGQDQPRLWPDSGNTQSDLERSTGPLNTFRTQDPAPPRPPPPQRRNVFQLLAVKREPSFPDPPEMIKSTDSGIGQSPDEEQPLRGENERDERRSRSKPPIAPKREMNRTPNGFHEESPEKSILKRVQETNKNGNRGEAALRDAVPYGYRTGPERSRSAVGERIQYGDQDWSDTLNTNGSSMRKKTNYGSYRMLDDDRYGSDMDDLCDPDFYLNFGTQQRSKAPKSEQLPRKQYRPVEQHDYNDHHAAASSFDVSQSNDRDSWRQRNCRSVNSTSERNPRLTVKNDADGPQEDWLSTKLKKLKSKRDIDPEIARRRTQEKMLLEELKNANEHREGPRDHFVNEGAVARDPLEAYRREEERLRNTSSPFDEMPKRHARGVRGKPPTPPPRERSRSPPQSRVHTPSVDQYKSDQIRGNGYSNTKETNIDDDYGDFAHLGNILKNENASTATRHSQKPRIPSHQTQQSTQSGRQSQQLQKKSSFGASEYARPSTVDPNTWARGRETPSAQFPDTRYSEWGSLSHAQTPSGQFFSGQERVAAAIARAETPVRQFGTQDRSPSVTARAETPHFPIRGETPLPYHPLLYSQGTASRPDLSRERDRDQFAMNYRSTSPRSNYYNQSLSRRSSLNSVEIALSQEDKLKQKLAKQSAYLHSKSDVINLDESDADTEPPETDLEEDFEYKKGAVQGVQVVQVIPRKREEMEAERAENAAELSHIELLNGVHLKSKPFKRNSDQPASDQPASHQPASDHPKSEYQNYDHQLENYYSTWKNESTTIPIGHIHSFPLSPNRIFDIPLQMQTMRRQPKEIIKAQNPGEIIHHHPVFVKDVSKYWYKPTISREQAINMLRDKPPGTFVVRDSNSFPGAFGLALKVATPPPGVQTGDGTELVRHFLIEPSPKGVKLKGCNNEPVFGSLSALVYQHSITPLALPTKLILPDYDPATSVEHVSAAQLLLEQGAACNVSYIGSVDCESLTGPACVKRCIHQMFHDQRMGYLTPVSVHFKVSSQGVTLTDNTRKLFFRRHFPTNSVIYAGADPEEQRWDNTEVIGFSDGCVRSAKLFAVVARKVNQLENQCHVFAELEPEQPAHAVLNFINKVLLSPSRQN